MYSAYPPLKCDHCEIVNDSVVAYRQKTFYTDSESNYVALCPKCKEENDYFWEEQWKEYYAGCL